MIAIRVLGALMKTQLGALRAGIVLATTISISAFATEAYAYTAEEQQACMGDAFRLCGSDIPNVQRITACMIRKKAQLTPGCRAHFHPSEAAVKPVTSRSLRGARKPAHKVHRWWHHKRKVHRHER
jgi:hypothetical protein